MITISMKKLLITTVAIFAAMSLWAADHIVERTYLSTDKACYVAGDNIWLSAFCIDATSNTFSNFSSIAYVELCSEKGVEATAKVALMEGRGAGSLAIPRSLVTGNYKLICYTAQNRNEEGYDYFAISKTISVFNTFTAEKSGKAVKVVSDSEYGSENARETKGDISVSLASRKGRVAKISLDSKLSGASTLSVSVYHEDGIKSPVNSAVEEFLSTVHNAGKPTFTNTIIPDFEGEVITGHVVGSDAEEYFGKCAIISSPGDLSGVYFSEIDKKGDIYFCTNNYYGDNVLVCQIESEETVGDAHIEFDSPFVENNASDIETLTICSGLKERLEARGTAMQIEKLFSADTLYDALPSRPNLLLRAQEPVTYILKDYTRFPLMDEVFTEFVKGIKFRTENKKHYVNLTLMDSQKLGSAANRGTVVLIDGTPVLDHEKVYNYDPLLVERIDVYPSTYNMGPRCITGIVNMVTYKRNMPALTFDPAVRIVDFQGACVPRAYTCKDISGNSNYPDYRNTLYWHPIVNVGGGETYEFDCQLPSYTGKFRVVVEGLTEDGQPIYETMVF